MTNVSKNKYAALTELNLSRYICAVIRNRNAVISLFARTASKPHLFSTSALLPSLCGVMCKYARCLHLSPRQNISPVLQKVKYPLHPCDSAFLRDISFHPHLTISQSPAILSIAIQKKERVALRIFSGNHFFTKYCSAFNTLAYFTNSSLLYLSGLSMHQIAVLIIPPAIKFDKT